MTPIVDYAAYFARKERERIAHAMKKTHRCGVCGAALSDPYDPDLGEVVVRCSRNRAHRGFERIRGLMERYKAGEGMSGDVAQALDRTLAKRDKKRNIKEAT